jgi:hypothetical protein
MTVIAAGIASVLVWQIVKVGSASAARNDVTISQGAPVTPAQFNGDASRLQRPAQIPPKPVFEPKEPTGRNKKGGPAPAIPNATTNMPSTTVNFAGLDFNTWGAGHPPDTVGDVGAGFYMQAVNTSIGIWAKTGGAPLAAFTFNTLWSGAGTGTPCDTSNSGDPTVVYDPMADRYIVADFAWTDILNGPYYECIAVSKTGNPVTGGYWLYAVRADDALHPWLPDYPKMGVWPDGLYMTANMFDCLTPGCASASYKEVRAYAFNLSDLESGAVLRSVVADLNSTSFFSLLPSNLRGAAPPGGRENLLVSESGTLFAFEVWKFHVVYGGPGSTFTGPTNVSQTTYTVGLPTVPSSGNNLDALEERMMMQNQYRNLGGTESLWVNHTVRTSSTGPNGIQWAQINVTGGTVNTTPVQQQIYGNVGADGLHRWMGSLAVDAQGDMALGYSTSKAGVNPDIRYNGRLASDPLNTLPQGEATLQVGGGSQVGSCGGSTCTRWGDYSAMTVDPADDCTFWYTNEYYAVSGLNWQTRVGAFKFPSCGGPPPNVCSRAGSVLTVNVTAAVTIGRSGASFNVTGDGNPTPDCGGATVNNIDTVNVNGTGAGQTLTIDLSNGRFEPGLTPEGTGISEIEMNVDLGAGADSVVVNGSSLADKYRFGTTGSNLNADNDGDDLVLNGVEGLTVNGGVGNDVLSLEGALGTGSALNIPVVLNGGSNNDKLTGGTQNDVLNGGDGKDTCFALKTADGADICNGNLGIDTASYAKRLGAVTIDIGGGANDGTPGEGDTIASDVENLTGGKGGDTVKALVAGANTAKGGNGNDTIDVRDGVNSNGDTANGGLGTDTCLADTGDTKTACEG